MFLDKIVTALVVVAINILLFKKYVNGYSRLNLFATIISIFGFSLYVYATLNEITLKLYIQILLIVFMILLPCITYFFCNNDASVGSKNVITKAKKLIQNNKINEAKNILTKYLENNDEDPDAFFYLGTCYKLEGNSESATTNFMRAVELDKRSYLAYYELGSILESENKLDTAVVMLANANRIKPDFYDAAELLGICYTSLKKYDEAKEVYLNALKYYPDSYELNYNIAVLNLETSDIDEAEEYLIKASKLSDAPYGACYSLGNIYYKRGKYQNALENYKVSRFSKDFMASSFYKMSVIYCKMREYENALICVKYSILADTKYLSMAKKELVFGNIIEEILRFEHVINDIKLKYNSDELLNKILDITSDSNFLDSSKINLI